MKMHTTLIFSLVLIYTISIEAKQTALTGFLAFCAHIAYGLDEMNKQNRQALYENITESSLIPESVRKKISGNSTESDEKDQKTAEENSEEHAKNRGFKKLAGKIPEDVKEIITFLQDTTQLEALGISMPKGILLVGPPGNGKTSIARAIAEECQASFTHASGSEFIEMYVGVGPKRIRELFEKARASLTVGKYKKAIVFIDEIDAIGGKRTMSNEGGSAEYRNTLTALLTEMDGLDQERNKNIIVIGATNTASFLDTALKRPGRFDRIVEIPMPDKESREAIIRHYMVFPKLRNHTLVDEDFSLIAERSQGLSAAELQGLVNESAIFALREQTTIMNFSHFEQGLIKVRAAKRVGS